MSALESPLFAEVQARLLDEQEGSAPIERIYGLLEEGELPEQLFHLFACDCVERALVREEQAGRVPNPASVQAIKAKRQWCEGEIDDATLAAAEAKARAVAHAAAISGVGADAAAAAADAASSLAYTARAAAWALAAMGSAAPPEQQESIRKAEASWQVERFLTLLAQQLQGGT